jgi:ferredoxin
MNEVEIKFEREDRNGIVAVGTYLLDAARRLGIELESEQFGETDFFVVKVTSGSELLSAQSKTEIELLSAERREQGERFANHAKIERLGEISIMTTEKKREEKPAAEEKQEEYRKEFEELPLEKKIASLLELEAIALNETFSFVINSPYKIIDMAMGVLAEFGLKKEDEAKNQMRPEEHKSKDDAKAKRESKSKKSAQSKKSNPPQTA